MLEDIIGLALFVGGPALALLFGIVAYPVFIARTMKAKRRRQSELKMNNPAIKRTESDLSEVA